VIISLVVYKNHVKIRLLVITKVKYVLFCFSIFNCCSKKMLPTQNKVIGYKNIPSDLQLKFVLCISLVVYKTTSKLDSQ